jgi:hypothetical protein
MNTNNGHRTSICEKCGQKHFLESLNLCLTCDYSKYLKYVLNKKATYMKERGFVSTNK